uniref:Copper resistance protein B n=1 Tax=uncultured Desulfobacterium sp. TaxID=201089 RepID=E1YAQ3_9BACT|nr:Copper resistance protein B [uncultured Desulfobacterium sp.]
MLLPAAGLSADKSFHGLEERDFSFGYHKVDTELKKGVEIRKYANDTQSAPQESFDMQPVHDNEIFAVFRTDRLEYQTGEGKDTLLWDVQAWVGEDYNKLWFKSEGTWLTGKKKIEEVETELFYSRNIATFWDVQAGVRHDFRPEPDRTFAAFGIQGLAPYWFEVEATAYISEDGDISATIEAEYDLLLTQRLMLQPRFETGIAVQEVEKYGVGQGINDIELGLRLRYEIRREFAPYIGISWSRKLGETADFTRADGEDIEVFSFVVGIKAWF